MNRRDFLKTAAVAAAGAMLGNGMSARVTAEEKGGSSLPEKDILHGVSDIHLHAAPDTRGRSIDEPTMAREARRAGYRSLMFKSNDWSCHDRAFLVREAVPGFECFGGICMNRVHGDRVNAYAAEMAVKTTGGYCRCIWMPTLHSAYQYAMEKRPEKGIPVLDERGAVLPEVVRVMEICAEAGIMFATGHSSPAESLVLAAKAREVSVAKFVVTHANSLMWKMTRDQIKRGIDLGAFIEYSYITNLWGPGTGLPDFPRMSDEEFVDFAGIAPERSFITSDLGQVGMPLPLDGMRRCIAALFKHGMPQKDVDLLVRANPAWLVGLE